jgi:hypothetical protein
MSNITNSVPSHVLKKPLSAITIADLPAIDQSPQKKQRAKKHAVSKLKQKNRKSNQFQMTTPLDLSIEAGNNYKLQGFSPDADDGIWTCNEVSHSITGKQASTTHISLHRPPQVS